MPVTCPIRLVPGIPLAAAALLAACLPGPDAGKDGPQGPLYSCIGEAGYAGTWEEIMKPIRENPPVCGDAPQGKRSAATGTARPAASPGDSTLVNMYIMDSECRFLAEQHWAVPAQEGNAKPYTHWDMRDAQGKPVRSGEYYVNTEYVFPDGSKDTVYRKEGIINRCAL